VRQLRRGHRQGPDWIADERVRTALAIDELGEMHDFGAWRSLPVRPHDDGLPVVGGALRVPGNVTPAAEFNIYADPHAAHVVLHAGWPLRLVPLDATKQAQFQREQVRALASGGHPVTRLIDQMVTYYLDVFGGPRGLTSFTMHDPLCLAAAIRPDLLTWQSAYVDVELQGALTLGQTVAYFDRLEDIDPALEGTHRSNIQAALGVESEQFLALYMERIRAHFG